MNIFQSHLVAVTNAPCLSPPRLLIQVTTPVPSLRLPHLLISLFHTHVFMSKSHIIPYYPTSCGSPPPRKIGFLLGPEKLPKTQELLFG